MLKIRKVNDGRYCAACKSRQYVLEIVTKVEWGLTSVEKSLPLCKACLIKLLKADVESEEEIEIL